MIETFFIKILDFFTVLIIKNLKQVRVFAVLLLAIGIVTYAVYYSDNKQIDSDKKAIKKCETENHRKDSIIAAMTIAAINLYERLILTNKNIPAK